MKEKKIHLEDFECILLIDALRSHIGYLEHKRTILQDSIKFGATTSAIKALQEIKEDCVGECEFAETLLKKITDFKKKF